MIRKMNLPTRGLLLLCAIPVFFLTQHLIDYFQENPIDIRTQSETFHIARESTQMAGGFAKLLPELHDLLNEGGPITTAHIDEWKGFQTDMHELLRKMFPDFIVDKKWDVSNPAIQAMKVDDYKRYPATGDLDAWKIFFEKAEEDIDAVLGTLGDREILPQAVDLKVDLATQAIGLCFAIHTGVNLYNVEGLGQTIRDLAFSLISYKEIMEHRHRNREHPIREN